MTTAVEEVREGSSLPVPPEPGPTAEARARARNSVVPDAEIPSSVVTDGIRRVGQAAVRGVALLDKPGSLVHSQPPTFRQSWDRHLECAGHYEAVMLRVPRYLWGCLHLFVLKPLLNLAEWITESPARFFVAVTLGAVIWFFA